MATAPFTIRIFVPDGDPEGVRLIERMGWTGHGFVFPREKWPTIKLEKPKVVVAPQQGSTASVSVSTGEPERDTVVVPARLEGFEEVFIGKNCWYAIRISDVRLPKIKYIAVYQVKPVMAVTHYAPVASIEPYGDAGKYKLNFAEPAKAIEPIPFADAPKGLMSGTFYTTFQKLFTAKKLTDLFK